MRRKKRNTAVILISALAVSLGYPAYAAEEPSGRTEAEKLSGELVISASRYEGEFGYWKMIAEAFMKEYPEVSVRIESPSEEEAVTEEFAKRLRSQVMTGECGDIVSTEQFDMEKLGEQQGLFEDLNLYISADRDFHKEDYFSCLFAMTEGEPLYQFTPYIQPMYVKLNKNILKEAGISYEGEDISFWNLAELDAQVRETAGKDFYLMDYGSYDPLGYYENSYYIRNDSFDTEEYRRYLEANRSMKYTEEYRGSWNVVDNTVSPDVICRLLWFSPQYGKILNSIFEETEDVTAAISYKGIHGERYTMSYFPCSISSFSKNKELAWEFMKFLVGDHDFSWTDYTAISVHKEKAKRILEESGTDEKVIERLFQDIEQISQVPFFDAELSISMAPVFEDYYQNQIISAGECAKQLADKVYLYKNE